LAILRTHLKTVGTIALHFLNISHFFIPSPQEISCFVYLWERKLFIT